MTPRTADDYKEIARRQREIVSERGAACGCLKSLNVHGAVITSHVSGCPAGEACDCPTSPNAQGVEIKAHVLGCPLHPYAEYIAKEHAA